MLKRALLAGTAILAATTYASADPVSLTIAGINAVLATAGASSITAGTALLSIGATTLLTVGQAVGAAIAIGVGVLGSALAGGRKAIDPGQLKNTFETSESGRIRAVGRTRMAGLKIYGNTNSYDTYRLIGHCAGPTDGIEEHYLGGRSVTVEADGAVSSPPFSKPNGSYVYVFNKLGSVTETAWAALIAAFPDNWTSDHKVSGICQTLVKHISPGVSSSKYLKVRPSGPPDYENVGRREPVYDPRTDTTAWSDNGVLVCLHVALTFPGWDISDFDLPTIASEADRADVLVTTRSGTEKRSRAWGVWDEESMRRGDLLDQVMQSTGVELVTLETGKKAFRLIDENRDAEVHIPMDQIIERRNKGGPDGVERPNKCRISYYSPEANYAMEEITLVLDRSDLTGTPIEWSEATDEKDRVGEQLMDIKLPFCPSAAQAQRIGRRLFAQSRADQIVMTTYLGGLAAWGTKTISTEFDYIDGDVKLEVLSVEQNFSDGTVQITGFVQPELTAWVTATDEALPPDVVGEPAYETEIATPASATATAVITYPSSGGTFTRIAYADPGASLTVEANYRIVTAGVPGAWQSMTEYRASGGTSHAYVSGSLAGQTIDFRHRLFNAAEDGSKWSDIASFTPAVNNSAPAAPTLVVSYSGDTQTITANITAPTSLQVSYIVLTGNGTLGGTFAIKPGEAFASLKTGVLVGSGTYTVTATPYASNGTAGTPATQSITI